jgi:hypothetical protein
LVLDRTGKENPLAAGRPFRDFLKPRPGVSGQVDADGERQEAT